MTRSRLRPEPLLHDFSAACGDVPLFRPDQIAGLPAVAGAYALVLEVTGTVPLSRPKGSVSSLPIGWYIYAGSARGPGGIRARLARHMRKDKCIHWHVDQVTTREDTRIWAVPLPDGTECDLVSDLAETQKFVAMHRGFGSSDCKRCNAHLLMWRRTG